MAYRLCKYRYSQMGVFQCEKHYYMHAMPDTYDKVYALCEAQVPQRFCSYIDFGFNLQEEPALRINCTHPYRSQPMESFKGCEGCQFPERHVGGLED